MVIRQRRFMLSVGVLVFLLAFGVLFIAWAAADGIRPAAWSRVVFRFVSFPTFVIASERMTTSYFWPLVIVNSAFWAILSAIGLRLWLKREYAPQ